MPFSYSEADYEQAIIELFTRTLGYKSLGGADAKRDYRESLYLSSLESALSRLNPDVPADGIADALSSPQGIRDVYAYGVLIQMTRELPDALRKSRTIDWQKKESARAEMRSMVKRLLRKYKYPPENIDYAIKTVLRQCEMWTDETAA